MNANFLSPSMDNLEREMAWQSNLYNQLVTRSGEDMLESGEFTQLCNCTFRGRQQKVNFLGGHSVRMDGSYEVLRCTENPKMSALGTNYSVTGECVAFLQTINSWLSSVQTLKIRRILWIPSIHYVFTNPPIRATLP